VETDSAQLLRCPLTGIWYDAPSPGASPFVAVGDQVEVGTTVGLVETMKVFNEVSCDLSGVIREILVHRGDLVAAHAPIMVIEPPASDAAFAPSTSG
jgi:acetyl-CoA carboxylase biotin carboxyl carrier protein